VRAACAEAFTSTSSRSWPPRSNFEWHLALSSRCGGQLSGATGFHPQVLHDSYLKDHPAPEDIEYYIVRAGADEQGVIAMLLDLGVDRENIMLDDFG